MKTLVICSADLDKDLAYNLSKVLVEQSDDMIAGNASLSPMADTSFICTDLPIELHEGSAAYFTEAGLM